MAACAPWDFQCILAPFVYSLALVVVLIFVGAFGGKVGKLIAIAGIVMLYLWWFGFSEIGLEPLRRYAGYAIPMGMVAMVAHRDEADETAARELVIYADNDADLYRQRYQPIYRNLMIKRAQGKYDSEKATKLFEYLTEDAAKKYAHDYATPGDWNTIFTPATREAAARQLRDQFEAEAGTGNLDVFLPKKYRVKEVRGEWEYNPDTMPGEALEELNVEGARESVAAIVEDDVGGGVGNPSRPFHAMLSGGRDLGAFGTVRRAEKAAEEALGYKLVHVKNYTRDREGREEAVRDHDRRQLVRGGGGDPTFQPLRRRRK